MPMRCRKLTDRTFRSGHQTYPGVVLEGRSCSHVYVWARPACPFVFKGYIDLLGFGGGKDEFHLSTSWLWQLAGILQILGLHSIAELRGRSDLLVYLE